MEYAGYFRAGRLPRSESMHRYLTYIHERFSPAQLLPLAGFFGVAIGVMAPKLAGKEMSVVSIVAVSAALFLFLFRLRLQAS